MTKKSIDRIIGDCEIPLNQSSSKGVWAALNYFILFSLLLLLHFAQVRNRGAFNHKS